MHKFSHPNLLYQIFCHLGFGCSSFFFESFPTFLCFSSSSSTQSAPCSTSISICSRETSKACCLSNWRCTSDMSWALRPFCCCFWWVEEWDFVGFGLVGRPFLASTDRRLGSGFSGGSLLGVTDRVSFFDLTISTVTAFWCWFCWCWYRSYIITSLLELFFCPRSWRRVGRLTSISGMWKVTSIAGFCCLVGRLTKTAGALIRKRSTTRRLIQYWCQYQPLSSSYTPAT